MIRGSTLSVGVVRSHFHPVHPKDFNERDFHARCSNCNILEVQRSMVVTTIIQSYSCSLDSMNHVLNPFRQQLAPRTKGSYQALLFLIEDT